MSEKQSDKKKSKKNLNRSVERRADRDSSPSAFSQSSVSAILEWDPSADVGTRIRPGVSTGRNTNTIDNTSGLSTIERIAMDLSSGYGRTDNNRPETSQPSQPVRSRSEEEAPPDKNEVDSHSLRSLSMIDLATLPPKKKPPHPTSLAIKAVQNQHQNEVSSTGSVATVVSHNKPGAWKDRSRGFETPFLVVRTPRNSPPESSTKNPKHMFPPPNLAVNSRRAHRSRQFESDANNEHESSDENIMASQNENRRTIARGVSEASTDWEYGPSRSQSHENDVSSISEWQSSGLTKSEIMYQSRRTNDTVSTGTLSVQVNLDQENQQIHRGLRSQYRRSSLDDNIGYFDVEEVSQLPLKPIQKEVGRRKYPVHIKTEIPVQKQSLRNPPRVSRSIQTTASPNNQGLRPLTAQNVENIPRRSKHQHKSSRQVPCFVSNDEIDTTRPSSRNNIRSNLSSTCNLLLNLVQRSTPPTGIDLMSTLRAHRDSHVKKFKAELDHLTELNRILKMSMEPFSDPFSSTSTARTDESSPQDSNEHYRQYPHLHVQPHAHFSRNPPSYETKNTTKNHRSRHTKLEKDLRYKDRETQMPSKTNVYSQRHSTPKLTQTPRSSSPSFISDRPNTHYHKGGNSKYTQYSTPSSVSSGSRFDPLDSFSFLLDKMNILADLGVLNLKIPSQSEDSGEQSEDVSTKKENNINKKTLHGKRAVSFYIPFPGCKCKPKPNKSTSNEEMTQVNSGTTLREVYERVHPESVTNMRKREIILAQMKTERETRAEIKREWVRNHPPEDMSGLSQALPPKGQRIMSAREMKELTRKKYKRLAEVKQKILLRLNNEEKITNRLMSQTFAHNLQKKILKGEQNIEHSRSIIRS